MSEVIEGLSLGLGLNTAGIDLGMKQLRSKLSMVNAEMKANLSAFDYGEKSVAKYVTQLDGMNRKLEVQKAAVSAARTQYEKMVAKHGEGSIQAERAAAAFNKEVAAANNLQRSVNKLGDEFKEFEKDLKQSESTLGRFSSTLEGMSSSLTGVGDRMKNAGMNMTAGITAPLAGLGTVAAKTAIDFEAQIDRVGAIAGATAEEVDALTKSAMDLGASTSKSATEVAVAQEGLASMGFTAQEIIGAMPGVISAAESSGADMAQTADVMAASLNIFGFEASEASRVADILAQTANQSAADITDMQYALKYAGSPAAALGVSMEELSASIGLMTDSGMQGEQAGTTLRAALLGLLDPSEENSKLMNTMGIAITDASGEFVGISQLIENLSTSMEGQTETQKAATLASLVGTEAVSGMLSLMAAGPEKIDKLTGSLEKSEGASAKTAAAMKDNLKGSLDELGGALETAGITIGNILAPAIGAVTEKVQSLVQMFQGASPTMQKTIVVFGAIAAAIGPIVTAFGLFAMMLGNIMTVFTPVIAHISKAGGVLNALRAVFLAVTGPVGLTVAAITLLTTGFIAAYKNSETFRNGVQSLIGKVKELASNALSALQPAIAAVVGFFKEQLATIQKFWQENSSVILSALNNIGKVIKTVFSGILAVINFIMPAVLAIIKMVWGNIQGVISGALNVIMGAVKIFSGLFSGNFSKMWEGIKQVFTGAVEFLWNFVQLTFYGKLLKGAAGFIMSFKTALTGMWTSTRALFSSSVNAVVNFIKSGWDKANSFTNSIYRSIFNFLKTIWSNITGATKTAATTAKDAVIGAWNTLKSGTTNIFTSMKKTLSGFWDDIVSGAKKLPGRIGDGLKQMAGNVGKGVKEIGNKLADGLEKGLNGAIAGLNWVLEKINVPEIDDVKIERYEKGTKGSGHPGGLAMVNDAKSSKFKELIQMPSGKIGMFSGRNVIANLPKGTKVLPGEQTHAILKNAIPRYEDGIGDFFSFLDKPKELLNKLYEKFVPSIDLSGTFGDIAKGGLSYVKDNSLDFIKEKLASVFMGDGWTGEMEKDPNAVGRGAGYGGMMKYVEHWYNQVKDRFGKTVFMGAFNDRNVRGGSSKSMHAFGRAFDIGGSSQTMSKIAEYLRTAAGNLQYVIYNRRIAGPGVGKSWRAYTGVNPHVDHVHADFLAEAGGGGATPSIKGGAAAWRPMILQAAARMNEAVTPAQVEGIIAQIYRESKGDQRIFQSPQVNDINMRNGNPARGLTNSPFCLVIDNKKIG